MSATLLPTAYLLRRGIARIDRLVTELHQHAATGSLTGLVNRRPFSTAD